MYITNEHIRSETLLAKKKYCPTSSASKRQTLHFPQTSIYLERFQFHVLMAERLLMQLKHYKTNIQSIIPGFIRTQESIYLLQHTIRPDIVNVPEIEEPKVAKWKIALTVAVLLTLIAILSTVLTSQLNEEGMLKLY